MQWPSFRRYDTQARYALIASIAAMVPLALAIVSTATRYDPELRAIQYGKAGLFKPAFLASIAAAGLLAMIGAVLGFNSAGQRRNAEQRKSWTGFFVGMAILSISIIVFAAFIFLRLPIDAGTLTSLIVL